MRDETHIAPFPVVQCGFSAPRKIAWSSSDRGQRWSIYGSNLVLAHPFSAQENDACKHMPGSSLSLHFHVVREFVHIPLLLGLFSHSCNIHTNLS